MKVELLKTVKVTPKGSKASSFANAGEVVDLPDADAKKFIKDGHAVDPSKKVVASQKLIDEEIKKEIETLKAENSEKDTEIETLKAEIETLKGAKK